MSFTDTAVSLLPLQVATGKEGLSPANSSCPIAARTTETVRNQLCFSGNTTAAQIKQIC